jgi:hypothetical protein
MDILRVSIKYPLSIHKVSIKYPSRGNFRGDLEEDSFEKRSKFIGLINFQIQIMKKLFKSEFQYDLCFKKLLFKP